jgi:hypothetical protein
MVSETRVRTRESSIESFRHGIRDLEARGAGEVRRGGEAAEQGARGGQERAGGHGR